MDSATLLAKQTIDNSARYWAGEFEIANRYFSPANGIRSVDGDLRWIEHQTFKEWTGSGVYGPRGVNVVTLVERAAKEIREAKEVAEPEKIDNVLGTLKFASDELRHFQNFARVRGLLTEDENTEEYAHELGPISEGAALAEMRYAYRESAPGTLAVRMSEGGGLGLWFGIVEQLGSTAPDGASESEKALIKTTTGIIADEYSHWGFNFERALVSGLSENEWEEVDQALQAISFQKLKERNQQFGDILEDGEMDEIRRGENDWVEYAHKHLSFLYRKLEIPLELMP